MGSGTKSPALLSEGELLQLHLTGTHLGLAGLHPSPIHSTSDCSLPGGRGGGEVLVSPP